jgi:hypothetical protein
MGWLWKWFKLWVAGQTRLSPCWLGLHRWSFPGGWCEKCGKCDTFFGGHLRCGKTCQCWSPPR